MHAAALNLLMWGAGDHAQVLMFAWASTLSAEIPL